MVTPPTSSGTVARICSPSFSFAGKSTRSSMKPTKATMAAPAMMAMKASVRMWWEAPARSAATRNPAAIATPPEVGSGFLCLLRSFGSSMAPLRMANFRASGVSAQVRMAAIA